MKFRNVLLVGGVVLSTVVLLTGCGKKENKIKNYEKELEKTLNNVASQVENTVNNELKENKTTENNNNNNTSVNTANEAIRKALKDESWLKENVLPEYFKQSEDWAIENQKHTDTYFAKMASINGNPAYLVCSECASGSQYARVVTYKDGKVVASSKTVSGEYSFIKADLNKHIVTVTNEPTGITSVYRIEGTEFVKYAKADLDYSNDTLYYYVNDEKVSKEKYEAQIKDCVEVKTSLTNENIDKYVK